MAADRPEKRLATLPALRISPPLESTLMRSAAIAERTLSDYVRWVLEKHEFGHARTVTETGEVVSGFGALQSDAEGNAGC